MLGFPWVPSLGHCLLHFTCSPESDDSQTLSSSPPFWACFSQVPPSTSDSTHPKPDGSPHSLRLTKPASPVCPWSMQSHHHLCIPQALDSFSATFSQPAPHFISNRVLPAWLLKGSGNCFWLSLCDLCPRSEPHQIHRVSCLKMHPLKSTTSRPTTHPSLKLSGTSSYLNVQASNHDSRASWWGPSSLLWLHLIF